MKQKLQPDQFVHLHNHTHHSLLDGLQKIPAMVERTKKLGMEAIAVTDHGTLSGAIEFYEAATAQGINPIIGIETYVAARAHTDKDASLDKARHHLILLAMNNQGYQNLMQLATTAQLEGYYHKPRIDHDLLEKYGEGLIVLSGCIGSEVGEALRRNDDEAAEKTIQWYKKIFKDRYYLEVQDHGFEWAEQGVVNEKLLKLGKKYDIPVVVTGDAHYLMHEDQEAHEALLCIQTGSFLADEQRMSLKDTPLHLADPQDIIKRWQDHPEVITNTKAIADRCQVKIELGNILIPKFPVPNKESETSYLHKLVYQGLAWRYADKTRAEASNLSEVAVKKLLSDQILQRTAYELETIEKMGFSGYFLIVQDFINWGKDRGIVFGPGRGSAAGSIVSYALNITDLDPLEYDLLFERFLNPERISMPDIDIDIQDNRRDEVIKYCVDKYGQDRVAHIVTFGKMAARNAIRDVARVLEVSYANADRLAKMVPPPVQGRHIPLAVSVKENADLAAEYKSSEESKRVIDLAIKLEGTIRSHGVHAAGVVIAPDDIVKFTPLEMAQKGVVTTQYSMGPIEDLGLLKMDFLGLSNLTIIKNAIRIVRKVYDEEIDISNLSLYDQPTFELLGRGDTTGVFQFESSGMKRYLRELKPTVFEDIIAMGALYRPGPLTAGLTQRFIDRKNGKEKIEYEHISMKGALESTYGVLVYQEQVMRIAQDMCGFTGGQADTLRKAIGKKKRDVMAKLKKEFVDGATTTSGVSTKLAEKFWKDLEGFADYAFNKSHAACYGRISYQTAYLKAHYPDAFMAALMTSDFDDTDRLAIEINECRHMGIEVLPPDVNESFVEFGVVPRAKTSDPMRIRFGMTAIKNVGAGAVEEILRAREDGPFLSIDDFARRVNPRIANRKTWESLLKAGAFNAFAERHVLLFNLDTILSYSSKIHKEALSGQTDLFGGSAEASSMSSLKLEVPPTEPNERDQLLWERELLGIYLSKHPLEGYQTYFEENSAAIKSLLPGMDGKTTRVGGMIGAVRKITTKKGSQMAFVRLEDFSGELELIVFPDLYSKNPEMWQPDTIIWVKGAINCKDRDGRKTTEIKIMAEDAKLISEETMKAYKPTGKKPAPPRSLTTHAEISPLPTTPAAPSPQRLYIHLKKVEDDEILSRLKQALSEHTGNMDAVLVIGDENKRAIKLPFQVSGSDELKKALSDIVSEEAVAVK